MPKGEKAEPVAAREVAGGLAGGSLDLSSFAVETAALEIRYPMALALWDRSGQLWKAVQEKWPEIVPITVDPRKTDFYIGKTRLTVEFEAARISATDPERPLDGFFKDSREFVRLVTQYLDVPVYKRVGFRLVYFKQYKSKADAASAFSSLGLIRLPEGKKFEIPEPPMNPSYGLRWESEKKGAMLQCRTETRIVDIQPPIEAIRYMEPIHREMSGLVVDVDYYTVASVEPGQMDVLEWMRHGMHLIARDSAYLFGG
jgi:hypothetical protein